MSHGRLVALVACSVGLAACSGRTAITVGCDGAVDDEEIFSFLYDGLTRDKTLELCAGTWVLPTVSAEVPLDVRPVEGADGEVVLTGWTSLYAPHLRLSDVEVRGQLSIDARSTEISRVRVTPDAEERYGAAVLDGYDELVVEDLVVEGPIEVHGYDDIVIRDTRAAWTLLATFGRLAIDDSEFDSGPDLGLALQVEADEVDFTGVVMRGWQAGLGVFARRVTLDRVRIDVTDRAYLAVAVYDFENVVVRSSSFRFVHEPGKAPVSPHLAVFQPERAGTLVFEDVYLGARDHPGDAVVMFTDGLGTLPVGGSFTCSMGTESATLACVEPP